ncbi:MAG: matrixin family metalloprotease [Anaerolineae bacterium]
MKWRRWLTVLLAMGIGFLLITTFTFPTIANVDDDWDWPKGGDGKPRRELKYCVEGNDSDFEDDVDSAAEAWNDENLGWTLTKVDDCDDADVTVKQEDMGGADKKGRITLGSCLVEGDKGAWQGTAKNGTIRINSNEEANWGDPANEGERNRVRTIMHEFGHAMRLDHSFGGSDIMKQSTSALTGTAISDGDRKEARTAVSYTIGGAEVKQPVIAPTPSPLEIKPKSGAEDAMHISPSAVDAITITPFFPVMEVGVMGWETDTIYAFANVFSPEAGHHEGATITIEYTNTTTADFHTEFVITEEPYTPTMTPHAAFWMTPTGTAQPYSLIRLDAGPSSHDSGDERLIYSWEIADQHSDRIFYTYHEYGAAYLPVGEYEVALIVEDYWGQEDRVTQSLTVETPPPYATLCTESGPPITDYGLRQMLDDYIDDYQSTLLVFTQCYAGDMADDFADRDRTGLLSATAISQTARYRGYHDDAARALDTGEGRTSDDVHAAGLAGKSRHEDPFNAGDLISLAPVSPTGEIQSRHVLVYGGCDSVNGALDRADRDAIEANFADDISTTVTTVGMNGAAGGWDYPGTLAGLRSALAEISAQMDENEQFILFVTNHGDKHPATRDVQVPTDGSTGVEITVQPQLISDMLADSANESGTGITLFLPEQFTAPTEGISLTLATTDTVFTHVISHVVDFNGSGVPDLPGEGVHLTYPVAESALIPETPVELAYTLALTIENGTGVPLNLGYVSLDSGPIARPVELYVYLPLVMRQE